MKNSVKFYADFYAGIVVLAGLIGIAFLILAALVTLESNAGSIGISAQLNIFARADAWAGKAQNMLGLGHGKWLGLYSLCFGAKLIAGAAISAVFLDIMYSIRQATK